MADTITIKQLVDQTGVEARTLRKILRARFPRADKGKAYEWKPNDPQISLILKAAKNGNKPVAKTQNGDKAQPGKPKDKKKAVTKPTQSKTIDREPAAVK